MVGMGGLESYPDTYVFSWCAQYQAIGMTVTERQSDGITWALTEGIEIAYQLDSEVSLTARVARLATEGFSRLTVLEGNGDRFEDRWTGSGRMMMYQAGASFDAALTPAANLNVGLLLGAGFASVTLQHRVALSPDSLDEFAAEATGVAFLPEFSLGLDWMAGERVSVGLKSGYRFAQTGTFKHRYATSIADGTSVDSSGADVTDAWGRLLETDFGGIFLSLILTAHL